MPWGIKDGDIVNSAYLKTLIESALGDGTPAQPASYTVFLDGSTIKARNGDDGTIDFSGTDASVVIQAVIDALTFGKVFLKAGTYDCPSNIIGKAKVYLDGEGDEATILNFTSATGDGFSMPTTNYGCGISNLKITNNRSSVVSGTSGLKLTATRYGYFHNLKVEGYWHYGIACVQGTIANVFLKTACSAYGETAAKITDGIYIADAASNANLFIFPVTRGSDVGINYYDGDANTFILPEVGYTGTRAGSYGIYVRSDVADAKFLFPWIEDVATGFQDEGTRTTIIDPKFAGNTLNYTESGNSDLRTWGHHFSNSGTSTGTGGEQTIPHGLVVTPNRVFLSNEDDGANPYQSSAADSTNIYVTAVNAKKYQWHVWKA